MAEFVSGIAALVVDRLSTISYQEICLAWGLKGDVIKLQESMSTIEAVLLDAEEKQVRDKSITGWLRRLKDVFLDAEDVLDEFSCEKQRKQSVREHGSTGRKVRRFISRSNPLLFSLNLAHTIKDIKKRLDQIAADCRDFGLNPRPEGRHRIAMNVTREAHSFVDASMIIGRDEDQRKIVDLLIDQAVDNDHDHQLVSVIPIIGIAGLGKTTLTRLVYNDERVNQYFELKMWVPVSKDFNIPRLIKDILESATGKKNDDLPYDQLQTSVRDRLKGKRFLLVLDDVWNEDRTKWMELRSFLLGGFKGSKIIVTTRSEKVAECMGPAPPYNLEGLSVEHSLSLFLKCAFVEGVQDIKRRQSLIAIGKEIVSDKCEGVPLAVITLGSLLYLNSNEQDWRHIKESEIWELEDYQNKVFAALLLSYNDLPFHLKRCFLCCSLFPRKTVIYSLKLIQLWMAHGLLPLDENKDRSLEDIGHQYFKELWSGCFFQYVKNHGWYYSFKMHDVIHDFALFMAKNEFLTLKSSVTDNPERVRHLSIYQQLDGGDELPTGLDKLNGVRTIVCPLLSSEPLVTSFFNEYLIKIYENLRMLDLSYSSFETLPSYIGRMKQLRSLDLSWNPKLTELPSSICKLQSLQSLELQGCSKLKKLPKNIKNLSTSLVFLSITTTENTFPENGIQCLTSLRTLMIVNCTELAYLPNILRYLKELKTLVITSCEKLSLYYEDSDKVDTSSLQKLILMELPEVKALPGWLEGCKESLQYLGIYCCSNLIELPVLLPNMVSLQEIEIMDCPNLWSLPKEMHRITYLEQFTIFECPKLREYVEAMTCEDWLQKICFQEIPEHQRKMIRKESSESGDSRQIEKVWTDYENTKLIQTISEFYCKGKFKVEDNFKPVHLEAIKRLLMSKLPGSNHLAIRHIESQIKSLETSFHIVHEILTGPNSTDFRWNSEKHMVTAENQVWDTYIQSHPEAMLFRDNPFPFYYELSTIFGENDARATRREIILADEVEESNERHRRKISVEGENVKDDNIKSNSFTDATQMVQSNVGFGDIGEAIKEAALVIAREIRDSRNLQKEINEKFTRLNDELMKITSLTVTERHKATHLISQNNATVNIFFSLPDEEKEEWVRALLKGFV